MSNTHTVTVIPGDGIGPDIVDSAVRVLKALDCGLEFEYAIAGQTALDKGLELVPQDTLETLKRNPLALKGPITTPIGEGFTSVNVALRKEFDLFANVRPALSVPGVKSRYDNVDIITVRENIEGIYSGLGQTVSEDGETAELRSRITRTESARLLRFAYDLAVAQGRRKVTVVHKANIMKSTSGLFLDVAREVRKDYPQLEHEEMIVDACAMQLVMNPHRFDVLVTTNLFGDILSDLCAGLVGGLGVAPGANIGEHGGIFEAVHGSAPDIAGQNIANPTAIILAAAMMLDHMKIHDKARLLRRVVRRVVGEGQVVTPDLGGKASTSEFTDELIRRLTA
ncbi:MAG: isocitrate dehydrogenase [Alcanivorax sp.]|nr:isocitrate dehydrogenase [Alcanivorax sp.]